MMNPFKKLKLRITLYLSIIITLLGILAAYLFSTSFFKFSKDQFEKQMYQEALTFSQEMESKLNDKNASQFFEHDKSKVYLLVDSTGKELSKSNILSENNSIPKAQFSNASDEFYFSKFKVLSESFYFLTLRLKSGNILQYGVPETLLEQQREKIFALNLFGLPILVLLIAIASYWLITRSLHPIKKMNETMNSIVSKNLSIRIPPMKMSEELESLSRSVNDLLERLEKSFDAQEHFVANASHQLYTPLAIMKGELEVLQSKERTQEEISKFHLSLRQELERMVDLVKNLLLISRIEAGHEESFKMRPMRLDDMMISTTSRMKMKAKEKNISIKLDFDENIDIEELIINGERQLLSSLFENLIDNSIKYSPNDSVIKVAIKKDQEIVISVQDEGPGIKSHELKSILEKRFQRGTMTLMPGTGIGLSIAYKIAAHHKAKIEYQKLEPAGSLFSVHFQ